MTSIDIYPYFVGLMFNFGVKIAATAIFKSLPWVLMHRLIQLRGFVLGRDEGCPKNG